jgi:RNA polymerase sigma factor (sigma-70 family)
MRVSGDALADSKADDGTLLGRVRAGDASAYEGLYQRHEQPARRLARTLVSPADVDDVVAEAFAKVLDVTMRGGGPTGAFRPYLLTVLRRVCYDRLNAQRAQVPTDSGQLPDPGEPFIDPAVASLERSLIARAFWTLPERWITVLWHTEIEEESPAEVGKMLGLSRNAVAALKHRALEGLRQAYLDMHIAQVTRPDCRPVARRLAAYVRGAASRRDRAAVTQHLRHCDECRGLLAELADINTALRGLVAPIVLGGTAGSYLAAARSAAAGHAAGPGTTASAHDGAARAARLRAAGRWRQASRPARWTAAGTAIALALAALAFALTLSGGTAPLKPAGHHLQPQAAAPSPPALAPPPAQRPPQNKPRARAPAFDAQPASAPAGTPAQPAATSSPAQPAATSSPAPARSPTPVPTPRLSATINVSDPVLIFNQVVFVVADTGSAAAGEVTVSLSLPPGSLLPGIRIALWPAENSGWTCQLTAAGASCQHGTIPAGGQAQGVIYMSVTGLATCGQPAQITAASGQASISAQSPEPIRC